MRKDENSEIPMSNLSQSACLADYMPSGLTEVTDIGIFFQMGE